VPASDDEGDPWEEDGDPDGDDGAPGVDGLPLGDGMPPEGDCGALGLDVGGGGVDWLLEELLWLWHPARASASASVTARATS